MGNRNQQQNRNQRPRTNTPGQQTSGGQSATGNPFSQGAFKKPTAKALNELLVKAEVAKLPEAPRAYAEKLQSDNEVMDVGNAGRLSIADRFGKI